MNNIENGIYSYNEDITNLQTGKQDILTFDQTPTTDSANPVASGGVKAALANEETRALIAEALKVNKPTGNPNGTQGQLLQTDGEGGTEWVDVGTPSDAQVETAVDGWLDEHPEATTTVQDGSITREKLAPNALEGVEIQVESESAFNHVGLHGINRIVFNGNAYAFGTVRYANRQNYMPIVTGGRTYQSTLNLTYANGFAVLTGTTTINDDRDLGYKGSISIPPGTYIARIEAYQGNSTITTPKNQKMHFTLADGTTQDVSLKNVSVGVVEAEFTLMQEAVAVNAYIGIRSTNTYNDYRMWYGIFASDVTIVDTGTQLADGDTYTVSSLNGIGSEVNTMQHSSKVNYVANTKEYIDDLEVDVISELPFVTPELFGAVGDGVADDTSAIATMLSSKASGLVIRGYKKYLITNPITIGGSYHDIFLNHIVYNGSGDYAINFTAQYSEFEFARIESNVGGIYVNGAQRSRIVGTYIRSQNTCIETYNHTYHNTFDIRRIYSNNRDCFADYNQADGYGSGENVLLNSTCTCPNGWAIYDLSNVKAYNFTLEGDVFGGIHINCRTGCYFAGFRYVELYDKLVSRMRGNSVTGGTLIKLTGGAVGNKFVGTYPIPLYAIDVAENVYAGASGVDSLYGNILNIIEAPIFTYSRWTQTCNQLLIRQTQKIMVPAGKMQRVVSGDYDLSKLDDTVENWIADYSDLNSIENAVLKFYPCTTFKLSGNSTITLNGSYCYLGLSEVIIDQTGGYVATVYDKDGNLILNGTDYPNKRVLLSCELNGDTHPSISGAWEHPVYDGQNDLWTIMEL